MSTSSGAQSGGYRSGQMGRRSGRSESRRSSTPVMPDGGSTQGVEAKPLQTTAKGIQSTSDADAKPEADVGNSSIRGKNGAGVLTASVLKDQLPYGYPSDAYSSGSFPRPVAIPAPEYADAANVTHYHGPHSWDPSLPMMSGVLQAPAMQPIQGANLHSTPQLMQHAPSQLMVSSMMYGIVPPVGSSAIPAFHADGAARNVGKRHAPATASRSTVRPHGGPSFGMNGNSKSIIDSRLSLSNAGAGLQAGTSMPPAGSEDRFERDADNGGDSQGSEESDKAKAGASVVENRISRKLPPGQDRYRESGAIVSTGSDGAQMTRAGKQRHAVLNSRGYPLRPGTQDCDYYLKNGSCAFGATCKFNHPELQWRLPQYHVMQCPMPYQGPTVAAAPYAPTAVPQMVPGLMPGGTIQYFMPLPSHMAPTAPGAEPNMPGSFVVPVQMMPPPPAATSPVATIRQRPDRMVGRAKLQQGMAAMQIAPQMMAAEQASGRTGGSGDSDRPAAPSPAAATAAPAVGSAAGLRHADAPKRSSYNHRRKTTHGSADGLLEGAPLKAPVDTRAAGAGAASWVRDSATSGVDGAPPRGRVRPSSAPVSKRGGGSGNAGDRAAAAAAAAAAEGAADGDSGGKRGSR